MRRSAFTRSTTASHLSQSASESEADTATIERPFAPGEVTARVALTGRRAEVARGTRSHGSRLPSPLRLAGVDQPVAVDVEPAEHAAGADELAG
jgi:hypothetical protein